MPRSWTRRNLKRRPPRIDPRPRVLIVCEGGVTEPSYLKGLKQREEIRLLDVEVSPEGVPKTVVARAVEMKKAAAREAKSFRDDNRRYDEVWCMFDVDEHPNVPEAKQQARANGINLAVSHPCFELWLLLHFQEQTKSLNRHEAQGACRKHMPKYEKEVDCSLLLPYYETAVERAKALDAWQRTRSCEGGNPSTGVYILTEYLHRLGREKMLRLLQRL